MDDFRELSTELNAIITKIEKKKDGVFFTPKTYREQLINALKPNLSNDIENILEPSFGSGEFLKDVHTSFPKAQIEGVEINPVMYQRVKEKLDAFDNINLHCADFIEWKTDTKYDLIIGNPPYVVVKDKQVPEELKAITMGRPNLYCWFMYKCIGLLKENGILAFVIPNSILNTSYYDLLRKYMKAECVIEEIIQFDISNTRFIDTEQATIGIILRKAKDENLKYWVNTKTVTIINKEYEYINKMLATYPTMDKMGIKVKTGSIVWNQVKDDLRSDKNEGNLLIHTSNIKNGKFVPLSEKNGKKQYVKSEKPLIKGPVILLNRGYGNSRYAINMLFVDENMFPDGFLVENHLNVIYPAEDTGKEKISKIYNYMKSEEFANYVKVFVGNGALSKTEIETLLPISL
jgi:adenine-specific DNA-methyltransferase